MFIKLFRLISYRVNLGGKGSNELFKNELMKKIISIIIIFLLGTLNSNAQNKFKEIHSFLGTTDGGQPQGDLFFDGTYLYGMTYQGGISTNPSCGVGCGTIFKIKPDGSGYNKLFDFDSINGSTPLGSLIGKDSFLYGMTRYGGSNNLGIIFKIKNDGTGFTNLFNFSVATGGVPHGSLIYDSTFLYGMTYSGPGGDGSIFKVKFDGTGFVNIFNFNGNTGDLPEGSLISDGLYLYGMTIQGGTDQYGSRNNYGNIFKIKTDGTGYIQIHDFEYSGNYGVSPYGSLVFDGTFLYGMTSGGNSNDGTIFKIKPDGSSYMDIFTFNDGTGIHPHGSLFVKDTFLYGMTSDVGMYDYYYSTIFRIKKDGTSYSELKGTSGNTSLGSLISDSTFVYGMTGSGGTKGYGTVFKYCIIPVKFNQSATLCAGKSFKLANHTYTKSGIYIDTLAAINGCDSIITTNLTVLPSTTSQHITLSHGNSITIGTHTYTISGTYFDVFPGVQVNGCDSTVTTYLTITSTVNTDSIVITNLSTANVSATIISNVGYNNITAGICYSTSPNPTITDFTDSMIGINTNHFTVKISALTPNKKYYVRSFIRTSLGILYGNQLQFIINVNLNNKVASASFPSHIVSAGARHTLFLCDNKTVMACGDNTYGAIGDGTLSQRNIPVPTDTINEIIAISASGSHSIFLKNDGTVWACGDNSHAAIGDGTTTQRNSAIKINGISGVTSISAGNTFSAFLKYDSTVWTCGDGAYGQLGFGNIGNYSYIPQQIPSLKGIIAIASGGNHCLFLKSDSTVWACGNNQWGQLGNGTVSDTSLPTQINSLKNIIAISGGLDHSLFLRSDGTVWACGDNFYGQLGDGTTTQRNSPIQILGLTNIVAISAGGFHSLFLKNDSTVWVCGNNSLGELGDGTTVQKNIPVQLGSINGIKEISAGDNQSFFVKNDGAILACGDNSYGQLGTNITTGFVLKPIQNLCQATSNSCYAYYATAYDTVQNKFILTIDPNTAKTAVSYSWDFGDGTTSTNVTPSHIYTSNNIYNVCLKITIASGASCSYCNDIGKDSIGNIYRASGFSINVVNNYLSSGGTGGGAGGGSGLSNGVQNNSTNQNISIFPNPTTGIVNIQGQLENAQIKVCDVLGKNIYQNNSASSNLQIDLSSQANGVYFINIQTGEGTVNKKIVISH